MGIDAGPSIHAVRKGRIGRRYVGALEVGRRQDVEQYGARGTYGHDGA